MCRNNQFGSEVQLSDMTCARNVTCSKNLTSFTIISNVSSFIIWHIFAEFPYKYMYVSRKYCKFISKKWFFDKCQFYKVLSQIPHGQKLMPHITVICIMTFILLLPCISGTCCYFSIVWPKQFIFTPIFHNAQFYFITLQDFHCPGGN